MSTPRTLLGAAATALVVTLGGCSAGAGDATADRPSDARPAGASATTAAPAPAPPTPSDAAGSNATSSEEPLVRRSDTQPRTRTAVLAIPSIGVKDLRVVPYEGTTDDWPGTRIQDRGVAASPYGDEGGVGPGETGNYLVTAHRLSAGGPLRDLPAVEKGDSVFVTSGGMVYEYTITGTRQTSFRSERSLAEQRAAVPGSPGERPTKAMITVSTCATPEDDAAGNFWRDDKNNPEHRIDKIGELTSSRKAPQQ
ncbi:class E sortase [Streptomyces sp. NPDC051219]|uniref:class E sortase n=1 Tax=Streptomyces sp. NPDC051219 TaxID=3155283 RepID=UPI003412E648